MLKVRGRHASLLLSEVEHPLFGPKISPWQLAKTGFSESAQKF
jgi:hypothetical protein